MQSGAMGHTGAPSSPREGSGGWGAAGTSLLMLSGVRLLAQPLVVPGLEQAEHKGSHERADQHDLHGAQANTSSPVHCLCLSLWRRVWAHGHECAALRMYYTPSGEG